MCPKICKCKYYKRYIIVLALNVILHIVYAIKSFYFLAANIILLVNNAEMGKN